MSPVRATGRCGRAARVLLAGLLGLGLPGPSLLPPQVAAAAEACVAPDPAPARLTFAEEFDAPAIGPGRRWETSYPWGARTIRSNGEQQFYTDDGVLDRGGAPLGVSPFRLDAGHLVITATPAEPRARAAIDGARYLSGLLTTHGSFRQRYGYFEIRAQLPAGRGLWPAFWLLPPDGQWPPELDILEVFGQDPGRLMLSVHSAATGRHVGTTREVRLPDLSRGMHRYGVAWGPERITWFFDGCRVAELPTPADMHQPMYMLVNLAVGGTWAGYPDAATRFPAEFRIDWIRVHAGPEPR